MKLYLSRSLCPACADPLTICICLPGSLCALPVLTQSPSASASLGASATLPCTLSSEHSNYFIYWYQQRPGNSPQHVMKVNSDGSHSKGTGISDRFTGSSSGANHYLTISNIQPEDEPDYYCWVRWGKGTG
uniref:Ig-like domain-containing protein n=1 Tax=Marmota marmota marmota TaxID=9994 RepID=A0A8C5Z1B6_MARMA